MSGEGGAAADKCWNYPRYVRTGPGFDLRAPPRLPVVPAALPTSLCHESLGRAANPLVPGDNWGVTDRGGEIASFLSYPVQR